MASVAGHELNHMIDYVSGNYVGWLSKYKSNVIANAYSEVKAYGWEINMDSPFKDLDMYEHYKNIINNIIK